MIATAILIALALVLLVAVGYGILVYNGLVQLRNNIDRDWSNIDVLLKQRFDELPKLIKVCEGYMQHEKRTLEAVIAARSQITSARSEGERLQAQNVLSETLRSLFMVVERPAPLRPSRLTTSPRRGHPRPRQHPPQRKRQSQIAHRGKTQHRNGVPDRRDRRL